MMSTRSSLTLVLATLIAVLLAVWALWSQSPTDGGPRAGTSLVFPGLANDNTQIGAVEIETPAYSLQLERFGNVWLARSHGDYPVRTPPVTELIARIAAMHRLEPKTRRADWYGLIGVEDRAAAGARSKLMRLAETSDGLADPAATNAVLIGKVSTSLGSDPVGGTFIRSPDETQAWLASGVVEVPGQLNAWFENLFSIQGPEITEVSISEGAAELFEASRQPGEAVYHLAAAASGKNIDQELLKRITQSMVSVAFEDVTHRDAVAITPEDRVVIFRTTTGIALSLQLGHRNDQPWVLFHADALPGGGGEALASAINASTKDWAFRLASARTLPLLSRVDDLLAGKPELPADGAGQIITDPALLPFPVRPN